jgi:hypothetical protein
MGGDFEKYNFKFAYLKSGLFNHGKSQIYILNINLEFFDLNLNSTLALLFFLAFHRNIFYTFVNLVFKYDNNLFKFDKETVLLFRDCVYHFKFSTTPVYPFIIIIFNLFY